MLKLLFADESGQVYEHPELLAVARDGFPLERPEPLPSHATLAALPGAGRSVRSRERAAWSSFPACVSAGAR